jgi:hypothetical protein
MGFGIFLVSDFSGVFSAASLFMAIYISVDKSVRTYVKIILNINSVLILLFNTPLFVMWVVMIMKVFGVTTQDFEEIYPVIIWVQHGIFAVWTIVQAWFISRIDFI